MLNIGILTQLISIQPLYNPKGGDVKGTGVTHTKNTKTHNKASTTGKQTNRQIECYCSIKHTELIKCCSIKMTIRSFR